MHPMKQMLAGLSFLAMTTVPASAQVGLTYDLISRTTTKSKEEINLKMKVAVQGDKSRLDIDKTVGAGPMLGQHYILSLDGGKRYVFINNADSTYFESKELNPLTAMNALAGGLTKMMKTTISNMEINQEKLGAGPELQGHATTHFRSNQSMDMSMNVFGKTTKSHIVSVTDYYFANDLQNLSNPFLNTGELMKSIPEFSALTDAELKRVNELQEQLKGQGLPLKTIVTTTLKDDGAKAPTTTVMTSEVLNLKKTAVSPTLFEIPAGYTQAQPPKEEGDDDKDLAAPTDSTPADSSKPKPSEDAIKSKAKKTLRGIFGKP